MIGTTQLKTNRNETLQTPKEKEYKVVFIFCRFDGYISFWVLFWSVILCFGGGGEGRGWDTMGWDGMGCGCCCLLSAAVEDIVFLSVGGVDDICMYLYLLL